MYRCNFNNLKNAEFFSVQNVKNLKKSNVKFEILRFFASTKTQISGFVLIDAIIFKPELAVAASDFFNY